MHPAPDAPLRAGGALSLDRTALAFRTPVDVQRHPHFDGGEAFDQALPSGTAIFIIAGDVDEVRFAEAAFRLAIGVQRFGYERDNAGLVASQDLVAAKVTTVGNDRERFDADRR